MSGTQSKGKSLLNADGNVTKLTEWATADVDSVEDAIRVFGEQGVSYTAGEEIVGDYKLISRDEKQLFMERISGRHLFVVRWEFREGNTGEYVSAYIIVDGMGKFIINDGSKGGIYGQLSRTTSTRIAQGMSNGNEKAGLDVRKGVKKNDPYFYDDRTGKSIPRSALDEIPAEHKKAAAPSWRFEF